MKTPRIALFHCPDSQQYKVVELGNAIKEDHPGLLWVFDASKMNMVKKIARNLNLAGHQNPVSSYAMLA